jgi:hypothetical protein
LRVTPRPPPPKINNTRWGWESFTWRDLGNLLVFVLLAAGLTALCVYLAWAWQKYLENEPLPGPRKGPAREVARVTGLPAGLQVDADDPWAEAVRARERGDYERAVVMLFAHQLLTLERTRLSRLLPGRTARQILRAVPDPEVRSRIEPTLRLFEAAYYGHRPPTPESFEAAWAEAEALEQAMAERILS